MTDSHDVPKRADAPSSGLSPSLQWQQLHHSLRNSLQMLSASLHWQSRRTRDDEARQALRQAIDRISGFARIHRRLQDLPDSAQVDGMVYTQALIDDLVRAFLPPDGRRTLRWVDPVPFTLAAARSIAFATVLTELVTNAVKHGSDDDDVLVRVFGDERALTVQVENLTRGAEPAPASADDAGEPVDGGFGLQMLRSVCQRSGGELAFEQVGPITRVTATLGPIDG